jgi:hypothetical protein
VVVSTTLLAATLVATTLLATAFVTATLVTAAFVTAVLVTATLVAQHSTDRMFSMRTLAAFAAFTLVFTRFLVRAMQDPPCAHHAPLECR